MPYSLTRMAHTHTYTVCTDMHTCVHTPQTCTRIASLPDYQLFDDVLVEHIHIYMYTCTHSHSHTRTRTHSHAHTHSHTHTHACTHTHTHALTLTQRRTPPPCTHTLTLTHTHTHAHTHAHTHSHAHIHTLAHTHSCTRTHTHQLAGILRPYNRRCLLDSSAIVNGTVDYTLWDVYVSGGLLLVSCHQTICPPEQ